MLTRTILHLDLDAFFCAVEEHLDPSLRGKPFAVGGRPGERGVVASCSYPARQYGIRSAMPMSQAVRLCQSLIILPARHKLYHEISTQVMDYLKSQTPLVEQISVDEAFLDISELPIEAQDFALMIQQGIESQFGLSCSIGVAANKLVAKIATDVGKASHRTGRSPRALTIVPPGSEARFLAPLPAQALWGIGPKTAARLAELEIHTIGDLTRRPQADLIKRFGKNGAEIVLRAQGIDDSPIVTSHPIKSISQEITFVQDVSDGKELLQTLERLSHKTASRLRKNNLFSATVKLKLRWQDFTTLTRQTTLPQLTDQGSEIYEAASQLFAKAWIPRRPVRLIGVGVSNLQPPSQQLTLWDLANGKNNRLTEVLDDLRQRYGSHVIFPGSQLATHKAHQNHDET